jgi:hypothetical protein
MLLRPTSRPGRTALGSARDNSPTGSCWRRSGPPSQWWRPQRRSTGGGRPCCLPMSSRCSGKDRSVASTRCGSYDSAPRHCSWASRRRAARHSPNSPTRRPRPALPPPVAESIRRSGRLRRREASRRQINPRSRRAPAGRQHDAPQARAPSPVRTAAGGSADRPAVADRCRRGGRPGDSPGHPAGERRL